MLSKTVKVTNPVGLHARPATYFTEQANEYKSSVSVEKDDRRVNAKSLLGILSLGITKDTEIQLIANGPDEIEAIDGLVALIQSNFVME